MTPMTRHIALVGFGAAGKDTLGNALVEVGGYRRMAFGDTIKSAFRQACLREESFVDVYERLAGSIPNADFYWQTVRDLAEPALRAHGPIDTFTPHGALKEAIRPFLVHGGQAIYPYVSEKFFREFDEAIARGERVVNTRLFRIEEARRWRERAGAVIVDVLRKGNEAKEPEEAKNVQQLYAEGLVDQMVVNDGTYAQWQTYCDGYARAAREWNEG